MQKERLFRLVVKKYYAASGRHFFWRNRSLTPFQFMLVELFLQRTRAENAEKIALDFISKYSNNRKLLRATEQNLFTHIYSLGLVNTRTKALKKIAKYLEEYHNNKFPKNFGGIKKIPHLGMYISNAIWCFAFDKVSPVLDVNSSRIICRVFSIHNGAITRNFILQEKAKKLMPRKNFKEYNWGLLDLGAKVCKTKPLCRHCPINVICDYWHERQRDD